MEPSPPRTRLRFDSLDHESFPDGRCRVRVKLEWHGALVVGDAAGTETREGLLRTAARATLQAVAQATGGGVELELTGIKAVKAFDAWVVIAAVRLRAAEDVRQLLGSLATLEDDPTRGAALAILDATNRLVERHLAAPESA